MDDHDALREHHDSSLDPQEPTTPPQPPAAFAAWLRSELHALASYGAFPDVLDDAHGILLEWRKRFDKRLWIRMMKRGTTTGSQLRTMHP